MKNHSLLSSHKATVLLAANSNPTNTTLLATIGLLKFFGQNRKNDIAQSIYQIQQDRALEREQFKKALFHYKRKPSASTRENLIVLLKKEKREAQKICHYASKKCGQYRKQIKHAEKEVNKNFNYFHRLHRWATSKLQDFFDATPPKLLDKYIHAIKKERGKIQYIENYIKTLKQENTALSHKDLSHITRKHTLYTPKGLNPEHIKKSIFTPYSSNLTSSDGDNQAPLYTSIIWTYEFFAYASQLIVILYTLRLSHKLPSKKYCVLVKTPHILEDYKLHKRFIYIYHNGNQDLSGHSYAFMNDENALVRNSFGASKGHDGKSNEQKISQLHLMKLLNRFKRGTRLTQNQLFDIIKGTPYLDQTKSTPKVVYCWDETQEAKPIPKSYGTRLIDITKQSYLKHFSNKNNKSPESKELLNLKMPEKSLDATLDHLEIYTHWYCDTYITSLLHHFLWNKATVIAQTQVEHKSLLQDNLQTAIKALESIPVVVIPFHINGNHWTGMVLRLTYQPIQALNVIYIDPKGNSFENLPQSHFILQTIKKSYPNINLIDPKFQQQFNDSDCGQFTTDNLVCLATTEISNYDEENIRTFLKSGSARNIRKEHLDIMQPILLENPTLMHQVYKTTNLNSSTNPVPSKHILNNHEPWTDFRSLVEQKVLHIKNSKQKEDLYRLFKDIRKIIKEVYSRAYPDSKKEHPTLFASYAWPTIKTSDKFKNDNWTQLFILQFIIDLNLAGFDAFIDLLHSTHGTDMQTFMEKGIANSYFVILFGTPTYKEKCEGKFYFLSNVRNEFSLIKERVDRDRKNSQDNRVIPIMLSGHTMPAAFPRNVLGQLAIEAFCYDHSYLSMLYQFLRKLLNVIIDDYTKTTNKTDLNHFIIIHNKFWTKYLNETLKKYRERLDKMPVVQALERWNHNCLDFEKNKLEYPASLVIKLKESKEVSELLPALKLSEKDRNKLREEINKKWSQDNKQEGPTSLQSSSQLTLHTHTNQTSPLARNGIFSADAKKSQPRTTFSPRIHRSRKSTPSLVPNALNSATPTTVELIEIRSIDNLPTPTSDQMRDHAHKIRLYDAYSLTTSETALSSTGSLISDNPSSGASPNAFSSPHEFSEVSDELNIIFQN